MNTIHYSSQSIMWATPPDFFEKYNRIYKFNTDVCAVEDDAKCTHYYTPEINGLTQKWGGVCWMNPPYGRAITEWVKKAYNESMTGVTVVCLLPARTDTKWYHEYCKKGEIEFIRGRLKFGTEKYWQWVWEQEYMNGKRNRLYKKYGSKSPAPFPSMIVVFKSKQ